VKDWLINFLSDLHQTRLKPLGYRKNEKTFSKDMGVYWLRFNFQSSRSNGLSDTWEFFINIGVEFKDLEPEPWWSFFAHTHWASRIDEVIPDAPANWRYHLSTNRDDLAQEITELLVKATGGMAKDIEHIRDEYIVKKAAQGAV